MSRWMLASCLTLLMPTAAAPSAAAAPGGVTGAQVEEAYFSAAVPTLREYRRELAGTLATKPTASHRYLLAYIDFRLNHLLHREPEMQEERDTLLAEAQEQLDQLAKESPAAEVWLLLGGVLGERIGIQPFRGMTYGPRASEALAKASELEPNNPRVLLQQGLSHLFTPRMFGGSLEKAEAELRRARALFAQQPRDTPWPNWGRADAMAWLGQLLVQKGDLAEAKAVYEQALQVEPRCGWIRYELLPALERRTAGGG